jgi:hypothetical protein
VPAPAANKKARDEIRYSTAIKGRGRDLIAQLVYTGDEVAKKTRLRFRQTELKNH